MKLLKTIALRQSLTIKYADTLEDAKRVVAELEAFDKIYLDIETSKRAEFITNPQAGLDARLSKISVISFYTGTDIGWVVNTNNLPFSIFIPLLQSKKLYAYNAVFESHHFIEAGCEGFDISCLMIVYSIYMRARQSENSKASFGLAAAVKQLFGVTISKGLQQSAWNSATLSAEQIRYSFLDSFYTLKLAEALIPEIKRYKLGRVVRLMTNLIPVIVEMERNGIKLDVEAHNKLIAQYQAEFDACQSDIKEYFYGYNPLSVKQFDAWAKATLSEKQLKDWKKTKTGMYSADSATLLEYQDIPAIKALSKMKENVRLLNTYGKPLQEKIHPVTGRIHSRFNMIDTATGRLSSSQPNAQNYPRDKEFRSIFVAEKGNVLVVSDFSQIETRIAGIVSRDPVMLHAYENGIDIYKLFAAKLYDKKIEEIGDKSVERQHGKVVILGSAYGMSWKKLGAYAKGMGVEIDDKTAKKLHYGYHEMFNVYSQWCDDVRAKYTPLGYVRTPLGRIRILDKWQGEYNGYTIVPNVAIQGGAAEVMFSAMIHFHVKGLCKILLSVHDEVVLECPKKDAEMICRELSDSMIQGFLEVYPNECVKDLAESFSGGNWAIAKEGPPKEKKK